MLFSIIISCCAVSLSMAFALSCELIMHAIIKDLPFYSFIQNAQCSIAVAQICDGSLLYQLQQGGKQSKPSLHNSNQSYEYAEKPHTSISMLINQSIKYKWGIRVGQSISTQSCGLWRAPCHLVAPLCDLIIFVLYARIWHPDYCIATLHCHLSFSFLQTELHRSLNLWSWMRPANNNNLCSYNRHS